MIFCLYAAVVLCATTQSSLNKLNRNGDAIRFNFFKALAGFSVFFVAYLISREGFHLQTFLFALVEGLLLALANQAGYKALCMGPMALTSMLVKFSLIVPFVFGVACWGEKPTVFTYVGFALLFLALTCLSLRRVEGDTKKQLSLAWAICVLLTLLANGFSSVLASMHQRLYPEQFQLGYTAWSTLTCFLIFAVIVFLTGKMRKKYFSLCGDLLGGGAGVVNTLASFLTLWLAASNPATVLYPLIAVSTMLMSFLVGRIFFREKLTAWQCVGFALGICAVVLLNL